MAHPQFFGVILVRISIGQVLPLNPGEPFADWHLGLVNPNLAFGLERSRVIGVWLKIHLIFSFSHSRLPKASLKHPQSRGKTIFEFEHQIQE